MADISKIQIGNNTYDIKDATARNTTYKCFVCRYQITASNIDLTSRTSSTITQPLQPGLVCKVCFTTPNITWEKVTSTNTWANNTYAWTSDSTNSISLTDIFSAIASCWLTITSTLNFTVKFATAPTNALGIHAGLGRGASITNDSLNYWNKAGLDILGHTRTTFRWPNTNAQKQSYALSIQQWDYLNTGGTIAKLWNGSTSGLRYAPMITAVSSALYDATVFKQGCTITALALLWGRSSY